MQPLPSPAGPSEAPPPGRAAVASSVAVRTPLWQEVLILPTDRAANPRHELWHAKAVEGECCFGVVTLTCDRDGTVELDRCSVT